MRRSGLAAIALAGLLAAVAVSWHLLGRGGPFPVIAEIGALTERNFDRLVPQGKEVDAIYGDYVLRNDRLVAVIGNPVGRRDANSVVQGVGGAAIDLTVRDHPSDLLGAFYPGGGHFLCENPQMAAGGKPGDDLPRGEPGMLRAMEVRFTCTSPARSGFPQARLTYSLKAGEPFLTLTTEMTNTSGQPVVIPIEDALRADGPSFERAPDGDTSLAWAYDRWFGQAYAVAGDGIEARVATQGRLPWCAGSRMAGAI